MSLFSLASIHCIVSVSYNAAVRYKTKWVAVGFWYHSRCSSRLHGFSARISNAASQQWSISYPGPIGLRCAVLLLMLQHMGHKIPNVQLQTGVSIPKRCCFLQANWKILTPNDLPVDKVSSEGAIAMMATVPPAAEVGPVPALKAAVLGTAHQLQVW